MDATLRLEDFDDPAFNPFFEDALAYGANSDPYPQIAALRAQGSVQQIGRASCRERVLMPV